MKGLGIAKLAQPKDPNRVFVDKYANPHAWLQTADRLHEQAVHMYRRRSSSPILTLVDANKVIVEQTVEIDKPIFLLGGFALENAIKAFLVYENPNWISNGRLSGKLKSHKLTELQKLSRHIPFKNKYIWVLSAFEFGLDSWFRYPCPLSIEQVSEQRQLHFMLWQGYEALMKAYGKKIVTLLKSGWTGPGMEKQSWIVRGETLGWKGLPLPNRNSTEHPENYKSYKGKPQA